MIGDPSYGPREMALAEYARKRILERTGVSCEWPEPPRDWTLEQLLREASRSGLMPHVFAVAGLLQEPATRAA
jgi:hypothetical protein